MIGHHMHTKTLGAGVAAAVALGTLTAPSPTQAQATPTRLLVRAVAHDAKIIGTGVGGARITVRDLATGEVLAEGVQEGSTGDTQSIVVRPVERGATVFDTPGAGAFTATLMLTAPTRVEVVAEGPLATEHATQRASKTVLMVPGQHLVGEGLVLELNGFTVEIESPTADRVAAGPMDVRARVTMLCGCPTQPGGLWDADHIAITARLVRDGRVVAEAPLAYAGRSSTYTGTLDVPSGSSGELQVIAVDAGRANTGMATKALVVR